MAKKLSRTLISRVECEELCRRLGAEITRDYQGRKPLFIGVLRGAFIFMADLIRHVDLDLSVDFISVSSYGMATESSGVVRIVKDVEENIEGRDIIIVEDIIDTGLTLKKLTELLATRGPRSIALCTAFDKPERRQVEIDVRYCGRQIPDEFIVGYGLDYAGAYRNLPDVRVVEEIEA